MPCYLFLYLKISSIYALYFYTFLKSFILNNHRLQSCKFYEHIILGMGDRWREQQSCWESIGQPNQVHVRHGHLQHGSQYFPGRHILRVLCQDDGVRGLAVCRMVPSLNLVLNYTARCYKFNLIMLRFFGVLFCKTKGYISLQLKPAE